MTKALLYFLGIFATSVTLVQANGEVYREDWDSLAAHNESPEWFKNAKFGIYFHWGPYSVPAYGNEHYPRTMYGHLSGKKPVMNQQKRNYNLGVGFQTFREHEFHKENYGEPKDFEYHDLVPLFEAKDFDAERWANLFYLAGAKFAGPVAEHHDGYSMWDSEHTPWNSADTGPKRDIVGEMEKAIRKHDMKFVTTFHHARVGRSPDGSELRQMREWYYYGRSQYYQREDPDHVDSLDVQRLYGTMPWEDFLEMWNAKLEEVIDQYHPDIIWFDSWLHRIPESNRQRFAAYYLNAAAERDQEVVITYKQEDMPQNVGVVDFEKGRMDELTDYTWLTDDTISAGQWTTTGSWSYTEELDIKSTRELLHTLIDIVSKNGNLLLNISPRADGIIPSEQQEALLGMGTWLRANGEAIYDTRPFVVYGEGPKRLASSGHFTQMTGEYNEENIRFTTNGSTIYAIQMGWPDSGKDLLIQSINTKNLSGAEIANVSVVDSQEVIDWKLTEDGLLVTAPFKALNKIALCYKIETIAPRAN